MKSRAYIDPDEPERLRKHAERLERIGKNSVASMWREMAERIESRIEAASASKPARIYFNSANDPGKAPRNRQEPADDGSATRPGKGRQT
jgi:hypothetical protein